MIIVNFWRKNKNAQVGHAIYIDISSNTFKRELKATLTTDWILNLPLTKHCEDILLLKRQNIRVYSDFWIHLRKLKAQWIPLTSSCSHQLPKSKVRNQKCKNVSTKKYHPMLLDKKDVHPDNNDINDDIADSKVRHHYWSNSYRKLDRVIRYFLWTNALFGAWME